MGKLDVPEKSDEVVLAAVSELLRAAGGDYTVAMGALLDKTQRTAVVAQHSTVASRQLAYRQMFEEFDVDRLIAVGEKMGDLINLITKNELSPQGGVLPTEKVVSLMDEHLGSREATEVLKARADMRKAALFSHMDEVLAADGVADPSNHNATLDVPERGYRFCREGAGYHDPALDEGKLRVLLGEQIWEQVCEPELVPARIELKLNQEKLLELAERDSAILFKLKDCLTPGNPKTPRLACRELK